ncbi:M56 family metallopeptidase [Granulicella arctica]|uniref:M56 family metallopeptidase n=1 Tax=Granulicella arctica TaxID=940613 RepID=UPI0021DF4E9E|nr:M56 family metallopeptidase [Granulicella arctica]
MQTLGLLAQFAGVSLVAGIWQGLVLAGSVWLCLRMVSKTPASLRFAIWTVVLVTIAMLPFAEGLLHKNTSGVVGTSLPGTFQIDARWSLLLAAVWIGLSLFRAGDLAIHALRLRSLRRRSTPIVDGRCAALLGDGRRVELCTSTEVDKPSVIGFLAPRILIPVWLYGQLEDAELEQIVLHEMEHLRRRDDWLNLLQKLSLVVFPLNPILVWVERRLCFERELACDDGVLRRTRAPRAYATCLTNLAERGLGHRGLSLSLGALGNVVRESELAQRVHRILRRETTLSPIGSRILTGAVALGLIGGSAGLANCPQVISFVTAAPVQHAEMRLAPPTQARFSNTVRAENVVFHADQQPHLSLLKASLPETKPSIVPATKRASTRKHRRTAVPALQQLAVNEAYFPGVDPALPDVGRANDGGWVVLSSWTEADRPRLILPVATDQKLSAPRYAAVPTAGGWLIIQL